MNTLKKQTCSNCLYTSSHPFGMEFNDEGVCSGCLTHDEKYKLDWYYRSNLLTKLVKPYRSKSNRIWDCIVPVTGGGDSFFVVHYVKNVLGMNPLLVSYNNLFTNSTGFKNLANLRILFNCDFMQFIPSPKDVKKLVKYTYCRDENIYWHSIAGQTVYPVQVAVQLGIPLIIWGAHQGVEQVGMFSHCDEVEMTRWYRAEHDLFGLEPEDLSNEIELKNVNLERYFYPDFRHIDSIGVRGIYLSNYIPWNSVKQNSEMCQTYGYLGTIQERTFDIFDVPHESFYYTIHDLTKQKKLGYAKVTDQLTREIRHGRLNKSEAELLNNHYLRIMPSCYSNFFEWIGAESSTQKFLMKDFPQLEKKSGEKSYLYKRYSGGYFQKLDNSNRNDSPKLIEKGFY